MEQIREYIFTYIPFDRTFPIAMMRVHIVAKSRKEAELIALANDHKFFDQDHSVEVKEGLVGFRE